MTADLPLFAARPDPEKDRLRARVAELEAELAALRAPKPAKQPHPVVLTETHARLLAFVGDGRWHRYDDLVAMGGRRFGARLLELKQAGRLVSYESRYVSDDSKDTEYRGVVAEVAR